MAATADTDVRFRIIKFRRAFKGYNVNQVDNVLKALAAKHKRGEERFAEDVMSDEFRLSWKGYLDEFLEKLAVTLTR